MTTIAVGVDGSPGAREALRFALDEALLRGASVRAISAWNLPAQAYGGFASGGSGEDHAVATEARLVLDAALAAIPVPDGVAVERVERRGRAVDVLLAESRHCDLLVVGSRGLGGFRGLLLGSVSQQCAQHAKCPVVVVPYRR